MRITNVGAWITFSTFMVATAFLTGIPSSARSSAEDAVGLSPFLVSSPPQAGQLSAGSPGHIDWEAVVRLPCCNWPGEWVADKIAFRSDTAAGVAITVTDAQVHNRWTWRYYDPDGNLESGSCFMDIRQPGEPGNTTSYIALVTNCPTDPYQQWQVLQTFPAGCPCGWPGFLWTLGLRIAGSPAWSKPGTWTVHIDYTDDYTNPSAPTIPDVVQDVIYLMYTPAVVLVHGWDSHCADLGVLEANIEEQLAIASNQVTCFKEDGNSVGYNTNKGVGWPAASLAQFVRGFRQQLALTPEEEVDIVGHSMGGLVARYYREELYAPLDGPIGSISMVGTPNLGVHAAAVHERVCHAPLKAGWLPCHVADWVGTQFGVDLSSDSVRDMEPGSELLTEINDDFVLPTLPDLPAYRAHAGLNNSLGGHVSSDSRDNDCFVSRDSVAGPNGVFASFENPLFQYLALTHGGGAEFPGCEPPTLTDDLAVVQDLVVTIKGNPEGLRNSLLASGEPAGGPGGEGPMLASVTDYVEPLQSKTHHFSIPPGLGDTGFVVYWLDSETEEANLGVTIRRPSGEVVAPTDPDVLGQVDLTGRGFLDVLMRGFMVSAPAEGDWQITVEGTSVPLDGQPYLVAVIPDSQVVLTAAAQKPAVQLGEPEVITAEVFDGDVAIPTTSTSAQVGSPDGTTQIVELRDDGTDGDETAGDHIYSGTFTSTAVCGTYSLAVNATASSSEGTVTRQQFVSFDVQVPGDAIRDPCNPDDDEDGLTDADELNTIGTDPLEPDTDADGMPDGYEHGYACLNPLVNDAANDPDNDGLNNLIEYGAGTNPCAAGGAVGGLAEPPDVELGDVSDVGESPTSDSTVVICLGLVLVLGAGGWYARRRWLH